MDSGGRPADISLGNPIFGRDRRRARRHRVYTPAYANLSGSAQGSVLELCEILNISESGACIQASAQMKVNRLLPLSLDLSATGARVNVVGHVVWSDPTGRTGIRFPDISEASRLQLRDWLDANSKAEAEAATHAPAPENHENHERPLEAKPTHGASYSSLVAEWAEIEKEVELCGPDLGPALHLIAQRALTLTWASGTAIALINKRRPSEMICRARAGSDSPELGARLETASGFSGQCVREGTAVTCDDTEYDSRVDRASCRALGVRSIAACPVKRGDEIIGILEVFSSEPAAFWENDITVLKKLTRFVASAVRRAEHARADALAFPLGDDYESETGAKGFLDAPEPFPRPMSLRRKMLLLLTGIFCVTAVIWLIASWIANPGMSASRFAIPSSAEADSSHETYATTNISDLKRLANQSDAAAEYALGKRYVNADGVKQDYREARRWFLKAAEQGHVRAQSKLAASFWEGRGGPQDYGKAYFWALLAQAGGDETAAAIVMSCAPHLSPAQTSAEQKAAEQWLHSRNIGQSAD